MIRSFIFLIIVFYLNNISVGQRPGHSHALNGSVNSDGRTVLLKTRLDNNDMREKYTLVDFWFSHHGPCIRQFDELRYLYNTYKPKGFEIIGISTDDEKYIGDWKGIIKQYNLP